MSKEIKIDSILSLSWHINATNCAIITSKLYYEGCLKCEWQCVKDISGDYIIDDSSQKISCLSHTKGKPTKNINLYLEDAYSNKENICLKI